MCDNRIVINGEEYVKVNAASGNRAIVVIDRGWVFAGNVTRKNGRILISDAVHVFTWKNGFAQLCEDPKKACADLRKVPDVDVPGQSEIYSVPVSDKWGK